jgi:AraC family transcriptional regulator, transcriptional activator of pobA
VVESTPFAFIEPKYQFLCLQTKRKMRHITTLAEYCTIINIPQPKHPHFDIRRFEDNMKTVNSNQEPFKHEFYALALKLGGSNRQVMGKALSNNLFFNTPYQIITWEIDPDWQGWYIMFTEEFVRSNPIWANFLIDFPFLRLDQSIPFDVPEEDAAFKTAFLSRFLRNTTATTTISLRSSPPTSTYCCCAPAAASMH